MKTQSFANVSTKQDRIAEQAAACPDMVFTTLHHHIDLEWMLCAWSLTRKDGAVGIDGVAAADYEESLESNLLDLMGRIKSGSYFAPPVRRAWIPKADGAQRPLGIPTLEDKVAQRAVLMLLEPIYEKGFLPCSYGFRPGRSAHKALADLRTGLAVERLHWVIDADISKYFDSIDHGHLRASLDLRIKDGVIRRMIDKWLAAGVLDEGVLRRTETGVPQGGVISPILSNVFLHHVLDRWMAAKVAPHIGAHRLVRFADDFVIAFRNRRDGERVLAALGRRFAKHGLTLHADKTRFVDFRPRSGGGDGGRYCFDFSASPTCGAGREGGGWWSGSSRPGAGSIVPAGRHGLVQAHRHLPIAEQHGHLASVIRGHCGYYGLTGNSKRLNAFRSVVIRCWRRWLGRRHRNGRLPWAVMNALLNRLPLPPAKVVHSIYAK